MAATQSLFTQPDVVGGATFVLGHTQVRQVRRKRPPQLRKRPPKLPLQRSLSHSSVASHDSQTLSRWGDSSMALSGPASPTSTAAAMPSGRSGVSTPATSPRRYANRSPQLRVATSAPNSARSRRRHSASTTGLRGSHDNLTEVLSAARSKLSRDRTHYGPPPRAGKGKFTVRLDPGPGYPITPTARQPMSTPQAQVPLPAGSGVRAVRQVAAARAGGNKENGAMNSSSSKKKKKATRQAAIAVPGPGPSLLHRPPPGLQAPQGPLGTEARQQATPGGLVSVRPGARLGADREQKEKQVQWRETFSRVSAQPVLEAGVAAVSVLDNVAVGGGRPTTAGSLRPGSSGRGAAQRERQPRPASAPSNPVLRPRVGVAGMSSVSILSAAGFQLSDWTEDASEMEGEGDMMQWHDDRVNVRGGQGEHDGDDYEEEEGEDKVGEGPSPPAAVMLDEYMAMDPSAAALLLPLVDAVMNEASADPGAMRGRVPQVHTPAREPTPPHTAASDISRLYPPQHWSAAQASSPRSHHHSRGALSEPEAKAAVEAMQHGLDSVAEVASAPSLVRRHSSHATTLASASPQHERLATQRQRRPQSSPGRRPRQSPVLQGEEQGDEPGSGTTPPQRRSRQRRPATATAAGPRGAPRMLLQRPYSPWSVRSERTTATAGQLTGSASFLRPASAGRHGSIRRLADDRDSVRLINTASVSQRCAKRTYVSGGVALEVLLASTLPLQQPPTAATGGVMLSAFDNLMVMEQRLLASLLVLRTLAERHAEEATRAGSGGGSVKGLRHHPGAMSAQSQWIETLADALARVTLSPLRRQPGQSLRQAVFGDAVTAARVQADSSSTEAGRQAGGGYSEAAGKIMRMWMGDAAYERMVEEQEMRAYRESRGIMRAAERAKQAKSASPSSPDAARKAGAPSVESLLVTADGKPLLPSLETDPDEIHAQLRAEAARRAGKSSPEPEFMLPGEDSDVAATLDGAAFRQRLATASRDAAKRAAASVVYDTGMSAAMGAANACGQRPRSAAAHRRADSGFAKTVVGKINTKPPRARVPLHTPSGSVVSRRRASVSAASTATSDKGGRVARQRRPASAAATMAGSRTPHQRMITLSSTGSSSSSSSSRSSGGGTGEDGVVTREEVGVAAAAEAVDVAEQDGAAPEGMPISYRAVVSLYQRDEEAWYTEVKALKQELARQREATLRIQHEFEAAQEVLGKIHNDTEAMQRERHGLVEGRARIKQELVHVHEALAEVEREHAHANGVASDARAQLADATGRADRVQESLESALADVRKAVAQVCAAEMENEQAQQRRDSDVSPVAAGSVASTKRAGSVRSTGESVATRA